MAAISCYPRFAVKAIASSSQSRPGSARSPSHSAIHATQQSAQPSRLLPLFVGLEPVEHVGDAGHGAGIGEEEGSADELEVIGVNGEVVGHAFEAGACDGNA